MAMHNAAQPGGVFHEMPVKTWLRACGQPCCVPADKWLIAGIQQA